MNNVKISVNQFFVLVMLYTIGTTILVIPSGLAAETKQDAWISAVFGLGLNMLIVWFYVILGQRFPNMNLVQYSEKVLGKWLGKLISLFFILFSFVGAATVLFYMGNFITSEVMPETPIEATNLLFAIIVAMGMRLGIETLARTAELLFPWVIITFTLLVIFLIPEIDLQKIQPLLEFGAKPYIKASLTVAGTASLPMVVLLMFFPSQVNNHKKGNKAFLIATLLGGLFFIAITFLCISVMGAERTESHLYPSYAVAKKVNIGDFIQRIEILLAAIWFITVFFKTSLYFHGFVAGLAQVFNVKDYRPLTLPCGMLLVVYSLVVFPNVVYMSKFDTTVFIPYALTAGLILPMILFSIDMLRDVFRQR